MEDQEPERDDADEFGAKADLGDAGEHVGATEVERQRQQQQANCRDEPDHRVDSMPKSAAMKPPPNSATAVTVTITAHRYTQDTIHAYRRPHSRLHHG